MGKVWTPILRLFIKSEPNKVRGHVSEGSASRESLYTANDQNSERLVLPAEI